jgi:hypothetical protein
MIVLGADMHKSSHSIVAVDAATGQMVGEKTVAVGARGFGALVVWARGLAGERAWALEDCRHVSGALERFLLARGERVVRVSTRLMATSRQAWSRRRYSSAQPPLGTAFPHGDHDERRVAPACRAQVKWHGSRRSSGTARRPGRPMP